MKYRFQKLRLQLLVWTLCCRRKIAKFRRCSFFRRTFGPRKSRWNYPCLYINTLTSNGFNQVLGLKMTRTDLRVLVDSKRFSFVSTNGMEPTFFEDNVVWKLQVRNFLPVFGSVFLFSTVWYTTILQHFQKLAPFISGSHSYLPGPISLVFKLIAPSLLSFCIGCINIACRSTQNAERYSKKRFLRLQIVIKPWVKNRLNKFFITLKRNSFKISSQIWRLSKVRTGWPYRWFWKFFERFR